MGQFFKQILLIPFLGASLCLATDIYKTVDDNGRVTYTDKPTGANSEKVTVQEPIVVPRIIPAPRPTRPEAPLTPGSYSVNLSYPTPEMHLNPGTFHLPVQVSTDPNVHPLHRLVIFDNGEPVGGLIIEYIIRGTHSIQAQVLDQAGKVLGSSEPVTVYVHRPTVNSRNNIQPR
jgi:hypothetical protein